MKRIKDYIKNLKYKRKVSKYSKTNMTRFAPFVIIGLIIGIGVLFNYLFNTYKVVLTVESDGYFLKANNALESLKSSNFKDSKKVSTTSVKENDYVYKTPLSHFVGNERKKAVDIKYPLFINHGLSIINYNEKTNLISKDLDRLVGMKDILLTYGSIYDTITYEKIDNERFLLLNYDNGIYVNLFDVEIKTELGIRNIPLNSFMYFTKNSVNYYERSDDEFIKKGIEGVNEKSTIKFYFEGAEEEYSFNYDEFLEKMGLTFKAKEEPIESEPPKEESTEPSFPIESEEEKESESESIESQVEEESTASKPSESKKPEFVYIKPKVSADSFSPNVYSLKANLKIEDPAGVIVKAPTFTLEYNGKVYARRAFYSSGEIMITGLIPDTEFKITGQYTYLDEDLKTKKIATFYQNKITTLELSSLDPIDISFKNGKIHSKKIEINDLKITSDLNSEALRGVKSYVISVDGTDYGLPRSDLSKLLKGDVIKELATNESFNSNSEYDFEICFYDSKGNKLVTTGNKGHTRTSKKMPSVLLKLIKNEVDYVILGMEIKNEDDVFIDNYRYVVTNTSGSVIKQGKITDNNLKLTGLDPNQMFTLKVYGDFDLNDGEGVRKDTEINSMDFSSLPITSLGFLNFDVDKEDLTSDSVTIKYKINTNKTDERLLVLLRELHFSLYKSSDNSKVRDITLTSEEIERVKNKSESTLYFRNLDSNTEYYLKIDSVVKQGETIYNLDCLDNFKEFQTRKKPAEVIANTFTTNTMIDMDVKISDPDKSILTGEVRVELRDLNDTLLEAKIVETNKDYITITYNNLKVNTNYVIKFIADEYNETNNYSTFKSKYLLAKLTKFTEEGISGKVELTSSTRVAKGKNLVDMKSETKWIQTIDYYTIPKTMDEEGDMHIYSKTGAASYMYDLSDYHGEIVTATFKMKAITPIYSGYRIFFENYLGDTTTSNYGIELTNISTTKWTTFTYTFRVGSYKSGNHFIDNTSKYYGKYRTDFAGFYITNGSKFTAEYEIRDLEIHISRDKTEFDLSGYHIDKGTYNSNGSFNNTATYMDNRARLSEGLLLEGDKNYTFNFGGDDPNYSAYIYFTDLNNKYKSAYGWFESGRTVYVPKNSKTFIAFRYYSGNQNIDPNNVNLSIDEYTEVGSVPYEEFSYDLVTNVRINLKDIKNEIANNAYYLRVSDELGNEIARQEYIELIDTDSIVDEIKQVSLEENKKYKISLLIIARDREYVLDEFDINTDSEVKGVQNKNDWVFMQPNGNYIILNDLDFYEFSAQPLGYGYKYFYGTIDFQGYSANLYSFTERNNFQRLGRIEKSGVLKNMVLNVHLNNTVNNNNIRGFVSSNYGLIENIEINVYDERETKFNDTYVNTLVDTNNRSGTIRNFTMNIKTDINLYSEVGLLTRYNYGKVYNGYVVGKDAIISNENSGASARTIGLIQRYGGAQSSVEHVYILSNLKFPNEYTYDKTGLLAYETYGTVRNVYTVGDVNNHYQDVGPIVGYVRATANFGNAYYMNNSIYTMNNQNKVNELNIRDATFQKNVLGSGFNIDEMIKLGYYPHVNYTYNKMPKQGFIDLPVKSGDSNIELITMEVTEKTNNTAKVNVVIDNPAGDQITALTISDVTTRIASQVFEDGKSYVTLEISEPEVFVSKYSVRSIRSRSYSGITSIKNYSAGEQYLYVDFYNEIHSVDDWRGISTKSNENFAIMKDLDFRDYANYNISSTSGKIEGNNHVLKNINIVKGDGLITRVYGTIQNVMFENVTKVNDTTNGGLFGRSDNLAKFENVHVKNISIEIPNTRTSDTIYTSGFVGYMYYSKVTNCSVTNLKIVSHIPINDINIGGMAGYSYGSGLNNVFVQNINIDVQNAKSVTGIGGIIGREESSVANITNAYATGNIKSNGYRTGGITGRTNGYVENTYAKVNIQSDIDSMGGITGYTGNVSYIKNNIYLGNMFSKKEGAILGRIISNGTLASDSSNFAFSGNLINGVRTDKFDETEEEAYYGVKTPINRGEELVGLSELSDKSNYTSDEMFKLGSEFDYSDVERGIMPKLYYMDTETLLPNQLDTTVETEIFDVDNIVVDKHAEYATIVLYINNPHEYTVTNIKMNDINVHINSISNYEGKTIINFDATPNKYYDSYMISEIDYKTSPDSEELPVYKNIRVPMIFYRNLYTIDDWQQVSTTDPQNYILKNDIDFTGQTFNKGVVFNRLESPSNSEFYSLKGMDYSENKSGGNKAIISKVVTSIRNIGFEDITISNTQTTSNDYVNIISYNYGTMENLKFKNITLNVPSKNRIAIVGRAFTDKINNITLEDINVTGRQYVSGFLAYYDNTVNGSITNIDAKNITVYASSNYAGGIFASFSQATGVDPKPKTNIDDDEDMDPSLIWLRNINIKDSNITGKGNYTGGIGAYAAANDSVVDNVEVNGYQYVGGAFGYSYESNTYNITVKNSKVKGTYRYIGGLAGQSRDLNDCLVENTKVEGLETTTTAVGGLVGYHNGYTIRRTVLNNTDVVNSGTDTGGIIGHMTGGTINTTTFNNGTVTGQQKTGGAVGNFNNGAATVLKVTDSIVKSIGNYAGGVIGYFNNLNDDASFREGYMRQCIVAGTSITSNSYAGGLIGGKAYELYNRNNDYELYFEGNVTTSDNITAGVAAGDDSNKEIINLGRTAFYNKSTVSNQSIEGKTVSESENNLITHLLDGFVNSTTGEPEMNYNYPNAQYTELIKLEKGKMYRFTAENVNHNSGDIFRLRLYNANKKYLESTGWTTNAWYYFSDYHSHGNYGDETFTVNYDCYVRFVFYYNVNASLYEVNTGYNKIPESKLLNSSDIRFLNTWSRYSYDGVDLWHNSYFWFDPSYWNFTPLNGEVENLSIEDKSGNHYNGVANVSEIHKDKGLYFDGYNDYVQINNYTPSSNITISTTFTSYSTRSWQLLFSHGDISKRYIGSFISGKLLYVVINNSTYNTGYYIPNYRETNMTVTYDSNKYLKVYINGSLVYTHNSVNKTIATSGDARTFVGHDMYYSTTSNKFIGFIKDLAVFNRAISADEARDNYASAGITNTSGLTIRHVYTDPSYESKGYYPIHKASTTKFMAYNQVYTELPTDMSVNGHKLMSSHGRYSVLFNDELEGNYHIYPSGINTINLEFDKLSDDLKFSYKIGNKEEQNINANKRVYSFYYDYKSDVKFIIKNLNEEKEINLSKEDLAKTISITNGKYYHIENNKLYENDEVITNDVVNLFGTLALKKNGEIYNINTKEIQSGLFEEGLLAKSIPLKTSTISDKTVASYYNFTSVTDDDGDTKYRDELLLYKDKYIYLYKPNSNNLNNTLIVNNYNEKEYQIVLGSDNQIYSYKSKINSNDYFLNDSIIEITSDENSNEPVIFVKYKNGSVMAFNYYNGEKLFEYGDKQTVSLLKYIDLAINDNNTSVNNNSYDTSNDLKTNLDNLDNREIEDILNSIDSNNTNTNVSINDKSQEEKNLQSSEDETTYVNETKSNYVTTYNNTTNSYEVYDVTDILDTTSSNVISVDDKIKANTVLTKYFTSGGKSDDTLKSNRVLIYIGIMMLIIVNLIILIIKWRKKDGTNET